VSVEISQSPIDRLTRHATIILEHTTGRTTKMKNISGFEEHILYLKQVINNTERRNIGTTSAKHLINEDESQLLEFKQSLRYDVRKKVVSKDVEKAVMKTIAGFMNADGGTLVIGVDDDKKVVGLANDYETLAKKNRDGFENHLSNLVKSMIGVKFANYVKAVFDYHDSQEVCIVLVDPSHKPAYVMNGSGEEFYVRIGNSTQPFSMSDAEEYIKTRWR
jgi:predicted HTH transcriptional regulator